MHHMSLKLAFFSGSEELTVHAKLGLSCIVIHNHSIDMFIYSYQDIYIYIHMIMHIYIYMLVYLYIQINAGVHIYISTVTFFLHLERCP